MEVERELNVRWADLRAEKLFVSRGHQSYESIIIAIRAHAALFLSILIIPQSSHTHTHITHTLSTEEFVSKLFLNNNNNQL